MAPAAWQAVSCKAFSGTSAEIIPEPHACPHHRCQGQLASLSHVMLTCPVFVFLMWNKAYMPIDANHISNPKDT